MRRTGQVRHIGGFFVRGLTGKNVAVYVNGVRFTTSAMRGGVNTFLNLNDVAAIETVEVIRGPSSAQFGSDSLGGTVQVLTRGPAMGTCQRFHGEITTLFSSPSVAGGGSTLLSYTGNRIGMLATIGVLRPSTLRTGRGIDSHAAVTRFLGLRSDVLGKRLPDTAFTQYGGMLRGQYQFSDRRQLLFTYQRNQQDRGKRYDQLLGGDGNLIADLRNLMLDFGYLRYLALRPQFLDQLAVTLSFNAQREERIHQGGQGNPLADVTNQYEKTRVLGVQLYGQRQVNTHNRTVAGDGYGESTSAPSSLYSTRTGMFRPVRGRIPDGARYLLYPCTSRMSGKWRNRGSSG